MNSEIPTNRTEIYLVRHGETLLTAQKRYIGSTDTSLSERGKQQVHLLAARLQHTLFDACYCSVMKRCQETAQILTASHALDIIPVVDLREIDYGAWETLTLTEIQAQYPELYIAWAADPGTVRAPQGESGGDVLCRIRPVIETIAQKHLGQRILLVAHRTVNRIWLCYVLGHPIASYRQMIAQDLTALNILEYILLGGVSAEQSQQLKSDNRHRFCVKLLNDTSHLPAL